MTPHRFAVVMRGYSPGEVDGYVGTLLVRLQAAQRRAQVAVDERDCARGEVDRLVAEVARLTSSLDETRRRLAGPTDPDPASPAQRVIQLAETTAARLIDQAVAQAEQIRARSAAEVEQILADARARAVSLAATGRTLAERRRAEGAAFAASVRGCAQRDARAITAAAMARRDELHRQRDEITGELGRLGSLLEALVEPPPGAALADPGGASRNTATGTDTHAFVTP
jgi:cell division septum initiation protein DivIVA